MRSRFLLFPVLALTILCAGAAFSAWIPFSAVDQGVTEPVFEVISSDEAGTVVEIELPGIQHYQRSGANHLDVFDVLALPGGETTLRTGAPALPVIRRMVGLFSGLTPTVEVIESEYITLENLRIFPKLDSPLEGEDPVFEIDGAAYSLDEFYPGEAAEASSPKILRDIVASRLEIRPVQYNPVTGVARIATKLRLRLVESGSGGARQAVVPAGHFIPPQMERYYRSAICNYDMLNVGGSGFDQDDIKYLIISKPAYYSYFAPLSNWREKMGYPISIMSVDDIGATSSAIKSYISDLYFSDGLEYVLFVGDITDIPAYNWGGTYSDSWYSCVDPGGGSDYLADLAIGRITFNNTAELAHQVDKIMNYLKSPSASSNWAEKNILCAHSEQYPGKYTECCEEIRTRDYMIQDPLFDTAYGGEGAGNSDVIAAVNQGRGIVNYRGHGSSTSWSSWGSGGSLTKSHVDQMLNSDKLFVGFGICCLNADLSYGNDCMSEIFMKADYAAVAYLSAWEPSYTDPNHVFDKSLFKAIYDQDITTIGYAENWANISVHGQGSWGDFNIATYLWLGDPATDVWSLQPSNFVADYPSAIPIGSQNVDISVMLNGEASVGVRVCLAMQGQFLVYGFTDLSGAVSIPVNPGSPGEMFITITGHNGLPLEGVIQVITPEGPWLVLDDSIVDDSAGNNDGLIDYGESIALAVRAGNVGMDPALNAFATLRSESPYATITNDMITFGDVPAGGTAWSAESFGFDVSTGCPDGELLGFEITFRSDGEGPWVSSLNLIGHAPELAMGFYNIDDSQGGDGDGQLEPGETAKLTITLLNGGTGAAEDVAGMIASGSSYLTLLADSALYPDIAAGGEADPLTEFELYADGGTPPGTVAYIDFAAATAKGVYTDGEISLVIGGFYEDMEDGAPDWDHYKEGMFHSDEWHLEDHRNHTQGGGLSYKCGGSGGSDYGSQLSACLETPTISLGENSMMTFWHWIETDAVNQYSVYDGGIVEISTNGGSDWTQIEPEGGYPYTIFFNLLCPFPQGTPCFGLYNDWEQVMFDLSDYSGDIKLRWHFGAGMLGDKGEGWYIDDVIIYSQASVSVEVEPDAVQVPRGGTLSVTFTVSNLTEESRTIRVYGDVYLPGGSAYPGNPVAGPLTTDLAAGAEISQVVNHPIPGSAPLGQYRYTGVIESPPGTSGGQDSFTFEVIE